MMDMDSLMLEDALASIDHGCCSSCHRALREPFVQCRQCKINPKEDTLLCLECFSKGREFGKHKKGHKYSIVKSSFSVLEPSWSADEEQALLNALAHQGEGNWDEISKAVGEVKTAAECKEHYETHYLDNLTGSFFTTSTTNNHIRSNEQPMTFRPIDDYGSVVVRPSARSLLHKDLAGYNAARGDFDWESDNLAEMELNGIEAVRDGLFDDDVEVVFNHHDDSDNAAAENEKALVAALSTAALDVYQNRLKKRLKRKRVVKELGLLNKPKALGLTRRYPVIKAAGSRYDLIFKMGPKLMCSFDFDFVLEGLDHELGVRQEILRLQEYRHNGIVHPLAAAFYTKLKQEREQELRERPTETILDFQRSARARLFQPLMNVTTRRTAGPLDIVGLPGYEKLSEEERDLCSETRVFPEVFLDVKGVLVEECNRNSGLRLADARPLVKIDVNKTRKLYDFLLKKEMIYPPTVGKTALK